MKKLNLIISILLILIPFKIIAQAPFFLSDDAFEKIPRKHYKFLEGYGPDTNINNLGEENWADDLSNHQSMVNGYWVKIIIK